MTNASPTPDNQATNKPVLIVCSELALVLERLKRKTRLTMLIASNRDEFLQLLQAEKSAIAVIDTYDAYQVAHDVLQIGTPILAIQDSADDQLDTTDGGSTIEYVDKFQLVQQFSQAIDMLLRRIGKQAD